MRQQIVNKGNEKKNIQKKKQKEAKKRRKENALNKHKRFGKVDTTAIRMNRRA